VDVHVEVQLVLLLMVYFYSTVTSFLDGLEWFVLELVSTEKENLVSVIGCTGLCLV
jgi:hypothetical protein